MKIIKKKFNAILKDGKGGIRWKSTHETREIAERVCGYKLSENEYDVKYAGWHTEVEEFEFMREYPDDYAEYLQRVKTEVEHIGKGYTCNFFHNDENIHHINGANHFCFSLDGDKVHPLNGGGSRFSYPQDFTRDQFIKELKNICLTNHECNEIYRCIGNALQD